MRGIDAPFYSRNSSKKPRSEQTLRHSRKRCWKSWFCFLSNEVEVGSPFDAGLPVEQRPNGAKIIEPLAGLLCEILHSSAKGRSLRALKALTTKASEDVGTKLAPDRALSAANR
jgi:hypothetical protein